MKQYSKHILEAINRGIQFALDDYEEQDTIIAPKKDTITSKIPIKYQLEILKAFENHDLNSLTPNLKTILYDNFEFFRQFQYKVKNYTELKSIIQAAKNDADLNWIDTSSISYTMTSLFENSEFNGNISKWDVSNVQSFIGLFKNSKFNGDLSEWDVSSAEYFGGMFEGSQFNGDISKWNISSAVNMTFMFEDSQFNNDLSNWDLAKTKVTVQNSYNMFKNCPIEEKFLPRNYTKYEG